MIPRRCSNEHYSGPPHESPAEGYNPLGLCPSCLRDYRKMAGIDLRVGEGNPAPIYRVRVCPMGCHQADRTERGLAIAHFCLKATTKIERGQTIVEPSRECVLLARVYEKPKRVTAQANDTADESAQLALGGGR